MGDSLLLRHGPDASGHSDAQVDEGVGPQLHGGPPAADLPGPHGEGLKPGGGRHRQPGNLRAEGVGLKALAAVFRAALHQVVHHEAVDHHLFGGDGARLHHLVHLSNDDAPGIVDRRGHLELLHVHGLVAQGQVAVFVPQGGPDKADVNGKGGIEQVFLLPHLHEGDDALLALPGALVGLAAPVAGIGEGADAGGGNHPGQAPGDGPEQLHQVPQGEQVAGDLFLLDQLPQAWVVAHMREDQLPEHPLPGGQVAHPPALAVPLAGALDQGQVPGVTGLVEVLSQRHDQVLRAAEAVEAGGGQGAAVFHKRCCLGSGDDLAHFTRSPSLCLCYLFIL